MSNENFPQPMDIDDIIKTNDENENYKNSCQILLLYLGRYLTEKEEENVLSKNEKDKTAFFCFKKSAKLGSNEGLFRLGCCYLYGVGIEKNCQKALEYFEKKRLTKDEHKT
ncbi:15413_t:CDS:2 [Dentiscutata heterogama]|uniref:15413_t:CDS:1 n=1 Tax=Dentiscutata heterogama TaxID=1316150 RepID=A0ACA9KYH5_9GLOM|nr:15413_t:CDS:2 [Dentiscutata heterogama]